MCGCGFGKAKAKKAKKAPRCPVKVMRETRGPGWVLWIKASPSFPMASRVGRTFKTKKQATEFSRGWCRQRGF
jgi:hypothetical protein